MCTAPNRCYVRRMRVKRPVLDTALDAGFAVAGFGLTAVATWTSTSLTGTPLTGPRWLLAVLPLLIGGPLLLRRRAPLLMWVIVWAGISLQALATHLPPRRPELVFVLCAGGCPPGRRCGCGSWCGREFRCRPGPPTGPPGFRSWFSCSGRAAPRWPRT